MGLLEGIQTELEKRCLPGGGWASGSGKRAEMETTCYAVMALRDGGGAPRDQAVDLLLKIQNPNGSWSAFEGDDPEGCWTTALAAITLRFSGAPSAPLEKSTLWLLDHKGREGHWFWKWKFRTADRAVRFDPDKYGWPWFPDTVSWVVPTAFSLIALKQSVPCCNSELVRNRIERGTEMLRDRACREGGWNAGNSIVFGAPLAPYIDTTAIALMALKDGTDPVAVQGLKWMRQALPNCPSVYSLAWASIAFSIHRDQAFDPAILHLLKALSSATAVDTETLSLAAIALQVTEGRRSPYDVAV
jgi:hypothetical protein